MENTQDQNDLDQYKHNVFEVLTKNVPRDVFLKKQKEYMMLLEKVGKDKNLLGISNFFDNKPEELKYESENISV